MKSTAVARIAANVMIPIVCEALLVFLTYQGMFNGILRATDHSLRLTVFLSRAGSGRKIAASREDSVGLVVVSVEINTRATLRVLGDMRHLSTVN